MHIFQGIDSSGSITPKNINYEVRAILNQDGNRITGEYIGATGGMCGVAKLDGIIDDEDNIYWAINYVGCGGSTKEFEGSLDRTNGFLIIQGEVKPIGVAPSGVWLGWENVTATKE